MPTRMYNYEARRARPALGVGSSRPHNTLSLVSPARRNVGADDTTASRSNNRLIWIGRETVPRAGSSRAQSKQGQSTRYDHSAPSQYCLDASLLAEALSHLPPASEGKHEGIRHVGHLNAVDARFGEFSRSRPPSGAEHHVVEWEPHGEILVAVLGPYRVMALPSCSPLRGAGSLGGEVLSRKAKKPANMPAGRTKLVPLPTSSFYCGCGL